MKFRCLIPDGDTCVHQTIEGEPKCKYLGRTLVIFHYCTRHNSFLKRNHLDEPKKCKECKGKFKLLKKIIN